MTATDELRRLLDERGVEYTTRDGMKATSITHITHWCADGVDAEFTEQIKGCTRLTASGCTPEQAIVATLGRGECEMEYISDFMSWHCLKCDMLTMMPRDATLRYCPKCGRAVKR